MRCISVYMTHCHALQSTCDTMQSVSLNMHATDLTSPLNTASLNKWRCYLNFISFLGGGVGGVEVKPILHSQSKCKRFSNASERLFFYAICCHPAYVSATIKTQNMGTE